jgi:hypothetical protein
MWRPVLCAFFFLGTSFGMVMAEEYHGHLMKIEGNTLILKYAKTAKELKAVTEAKGVGIYKGKFNVYTQKQGGEKVKITGNNPLAADVFKNIHPEKGLRVIFTTGEGDSDNKVTELIVIMKK